MNHDQLIEKISDAMARTCIGWDEPVTQETIADIQRVRRSDEVLAAIAESEAPKLKSQEKP